MAAAGDDGGAPRVAAAAEDATGASAPGGGGSVPSASEALPGVTRELAGLVISGDATGVEAFDNTIEDSFARIDELTLLVESTRADVDKSRREVLPQLLAGCEELERLFDTVDKLEGFVDRVAGCSNELAARARVLHGAFEKRYPTSVKRMMRSLAFMGSKGGSTEPIEIPEWDPSIATFSSGEFFDELRSAAAAAAAARDTTA